MKLKSIVVIGILLLGFGSGCDKEINSQNVGAGVTTTTQGEDGLGKEGSLVVSEKWLESMPESGQLAVYQSNDKEPLYTLFWDAKGWHMVAPSVGLNRVALDSNYASRLTEIFRSSIFRKPKLETMDRKDQFGFKDNDGRKVIVRSEHLKQPIVFYLGKYVVREGVGQTYVMSEDRKMLFQARTDLGELLNLSPAELRSKDVADLQTGKLVSVKSASYTNPEEVYYVLDDLDKEPDAWRNMAEPNSEVDQALVREVIYIYTKLTVSHFQSEARFERIPKNQLRTLTLTYEDGSERVLWVGSLDMDGVTLNLVKDRREGWVALSSDLYRMAYLESSDLRKRNVRTLDIMDVLRVKFPSEEGITVVRQGPTRFDWIQSYPQPGALLSTKMAKKWVLSAATPFAVRMADISMREAGLANPMPNQILEIETKQGRRYQLAFGNKTDRGDGYYAMWQDQLEIFVVTTHFYESTHPSVTTFTTGDN